VTRLSTARSSAWTGVPSWPTTREPFFHEVENGAEPGEGGGEHADQQLAPREPGLLHQGCLEVGRLLRGRRRRMALLDDDGRVHQLPGPHHDADTEAGQGDPEQNPLHLGLAAEDVHDEQGDAGQRGDPEEDRDRELDAGGTRHQPRCRRSIQRVTPSKATR
jgi:hypothetical protein